MDAHAAPTQQAAPRTGRFAHGAWAGIFLSNLPVPLTFGWMVTREGGLVGMWIGILVVLLLGHLAIAKVRSLRSVLLFEGLCTAVSQVFLVLHIVVGIVAVDVLGPGPSHVHPLTEWGAFYVTLLTAAQLIVVALLCGLALRAMGLMIEGRISRGQY